MRVLSGEGLVTQLADSSYELTELGAELKTGALRELAQFVGSPSQWEPWNQLTESLRTGGCAFEASQGKPLFQYLAEHPEEARLYDAAVDAFTREQATALAKHPVMDGVDCVVDVGGGKGSLLLELLTRRQGLKGILVDRPDVVAAAAPRFAAAGLGERCQTWGGDFFEALPRGADCYVVKHVLHNWPDDVAVRMLRFCSEVMAPNAKLLIVDGVLLPGNVKDLTRYLDLEMFVLTGAGRERSKPEFRHLLSQAGLRLKETHALALGAWLLVAEKAKG
jgi:hypothetical protein